MTTMLCDRILRAIMVRHKATCVPIWSCQKHHSLVPFTVSNVRSLSTDIPTSPPSERDSPPLLSPSQSEVSMRMRHGLPQITVPLPSRDEPCMFTLKPVTHTIGDLLRMLKEEDAGIDRAVVRSASSGVRIASTTSVQTLLQEDFDLVINDTSYRVHPPPATTMEISEQEQHRLGDVRNLVGQLYEALNMEEHQARQERRLVEQIEALQTELAPLEQQRRSLAVQAERRTTQLTWLGLGMMSVQFGILARLTWWEYSWDIMEPVTYFVTYGTAMACYAYFVLTKQDYLLPDVRDRQFLLTFHKRARSNAWDVERYNELRDSLKDVEKDLQRLRDPLRLRLPQTRKDPHGEEQQQHSILGAQLKIDHFKNILKSKLS